MATEPDVIVDVPICHRTAFVLDRFLGNQREIQAAYPKCTLATDETDFAGEGTSVAGRATVSREECRVA